MTRSIKNWSDDADAKLQDCFASTGLEYVLGFFQGIEEYITSVTGFINKCHDDVVPTLTIHTLLKKIKGTLKHNVTPSQSHFCEIKLST